MLISTSVQVSVLTIYTYRASVKKRFHALGVPWHIGSQLTEVEPFELAVKKILPLTTRLAAKYNFEFLSIGGGLGIVYNPALASGSAQWWKSAQAKGILTPNCLERDWCRF